MYELTFGHDDISLDVDKVVIDLCLAFELKCGIWTASMWFLFA